VEQSTLYIHILAQTRDTKVYASNIYVTNTSTKKKNSMPTENQDFQKKGACVQISKGRTERVVFTREGLLLRNGNEIHTYNKEFGGNSDGNEAPDGWVKMGDGLMLVLKDINTQDMRLVFLDNEPLERNINRLADRVRLNAIVNVAKQEVKESARLTAVIFKAIDISDVSSGKCFGYLIDFKDTESPAAFKNVLIGKNSAVKALSSKSGFRGGVGGSDNNKSDTEKDKTIGGFGGFGEKTSPKKDAKETSIFGGGSSTSNIESKKGTTSSTFGFGGGVVGSDNDKSDTEKDKTIGGFGGFGEKTSSKKADDGKQTSLFGGGSTSKDASKKDTPESSTFDFGGFGGFGEKTSPKKVEDAKETSLFGGGSSTSNIESKKGTTSSTFGFGGGVVGSDNDKSDTEKDKTIGGFGGFGGKTSPKKADDGKQTSLFGGGSTSKDASKKDTSESSTFDFGGKTSSTFGFGGGAVGSDNNKSDTEKDKTIGGFGGFGEKTSPKKADDGKQTSLFGGGSTSNIESKKDTSLPMFGSDALPTEERPPSVRFGSDDKSKTELETKTKMVDYKEEITKIIKQYNPAKLGNIDILLNGKYKGKGHELLEKMQKKYLATANTSSGGFGSSNAPKPVDMGGFGSGGGFGNSDGSDAKSNGLSFGSSAGFGSSNAPKPVEMGGFGSGGFGKSSGGGSGFGAVSSNNNGGGGGFGGFGGGGQNNTNNTSASFSSPSFTQMRG
jgi:hypothetical protein